MTEYYQPKYDEIIRTISQYPYGHDKIGNLYVLRDKNFLPDNNTRYKYIELSDIGVNGEISGKHLRVRFKSSEPSKTCPVQYLEILSFLRSKVLCKVVRL